MPIDMLSGDSRSVVMCESSVPFDVICLSQSGPSSAKNFDLRSFLDFNH